MSDTPSRDDPWRRLAAELGLDVGPESEQSTPPAPPPDDVPAARAEPPAREPDVEREPPLDRGRRRRPAAVGLGEGLEPAEVEEPPARGRRGQTAPPPAEDAVPEPAFDWSQAAES